MSPRTEQPPHRISRPPVHRLSRPGQFWPSSRISQPRRPGPGTRRGLPRTFGACAAAAPTPGTLPSNSCRACRCFPLDSSRAVRCPALATRSASVNWNWTKSDTRSLEPGVRLLTGLVQQATVKRDCHSAQPFNRARHRPGGGQQPPLGRHDTLPGELTPHRRVAAQARSVRTPREAACRGVASRRGAGEWGRGRAGEVGGRVRRPGGGVAGVGPGGTARVAPPSRGGRRNPSSRW